MSLGSSSPHRPQGISCGIRILQLNMRRSSLCFSLLVDYLSHNSVDVLLLQDPSADLQTFQRGIFGYSLFLPTNYGGRCRNASPMVAILVRDPLRAQSIIFDNQRVCGVLLDSPLGLVACISAYLHFRHGTGLDALSSMLSKVKMQTPFIFLAVDTNGHSPWWGPPNQASNETGQLFEDFVLSHNLQIANRWPTPPTFVSDRGFEAWLDVSLLSSRLSLFLLSWTVLENEDLASDHRAILTTMDTSVSFRDIQVCRDWRSVDWASFHSALASLLDALFCEPCPVDSPADLDHYVGLLTSAIQSVSRSYVPLKRICWASRPWWSHELTDLHKQLNRLRRQWNRHKTRDNKRAVNACRRHLQKAISRAKHASWRKMCEQASDEDIWTAFRKLTRPRRLRTIPVLRVNDDHIADDEGKARVLLDRFFPSVLPPDNDFHVGVSSRVFSFLDSDPQGTIFAISSSELHAALWSCSPWKAPGIDQVPNICLRQCEDILSDHLLTIFNASLRLQHFPQNWKLAAVVPVPKPSHDLSLPKGYRPISLLSCLSKILERIVADRITFHLESSSSLSHHQYGFRKTRSTELALWNFVAAAGVALQSRRKTTVIALDIQGAYDRVWHAGLLTKMIDMHFSPALLRWVSAFLSPRTVTLQVGEVQESRQLSMGLPQGSPLSPVLFLIFINDLLTSLSPMVNVQAYADDVFLWWHSDKGDSGESVGLDVLGMVERWAGQWKVTFDSSKCHPMVISNLRNEPTPSFVFCGTALPLVPRLEYLGVTLDPHLNWQAHVEQVTREALERLRLIRHGVGALWGLHPKIISRMIHAAVLPALFYAAPVWSLAVCTRTRLLSLDRVLRLCGICTLGLLRTVSHDAACVLAGLFPADIYLRFQLVQFYLRQLTYDRDLLAPDDNHLRCNCIPTPRDLLRRELLSLAASGHASQSMLQRVERRSFWSTHPSFLQWTPPISILSRDDAISSFYHAWETTSSDTLWIFVDGSRVASNCGVAAAFFRGHLIQGQPISQRFAGHHSTTQVELVAIRLGSEHALLLGFFPSIILISDSQAALQSLSSGQGCSQLSTAARQALYELSFRTRYLSLQWLPGHIDISQHDLVDDIAKKATSNSATRSLSDVPFCRKILRSRIYAHYMARADTQWTTSSRGRDLHQIQPLFSRDLSWTQDLTRRESALVAQFLSGHYPTQSYLHRFGLSTDYTCQWCGAPLDDREHRLLRCPRFDYQRQRLASDITQHTHGTHGWSWQYLVSEGRHYLARFLSFVCKATPFST